MKLKKPQSVEEYIELNSKFSQELTFLRRLILETDLEESVKWMFPVYGYKTKNVLSLAAFKDYVGIWFFQGVFLEDKAGVLQNAQEGKTKAMRQWRFKDLAELKKQKTVLQYYIEEAIQNQKEGKELPKAKPNRKLTIPTELKLRLENNQGLKFAFESLSPYKKKEYCEFIISAKREKTKLSRLEKIIPMILAQKGLNDKYK